MLDLRDSENSNWIKNVGQQDEGEDIEKSLPLLTLQEWLDKQAHDDLRPMNPPSRPPNKGAVWNSNTHRWSKAGTADLDKQDGVSSIAEAKRRGLVPQSGNWEKPVRWVTPDDLDEESDKDREKKAEAMTQPKGGISQKLNKFNDKVEKILKVLDDLFGGHVENPQQTFEDLEKLKGEVDQEIEHGKGKIDENEGKLDGLHKAEKIDDETREKARKELEEMREYYTKQEKEMNEKWESESMEKLKQRLLLEEQAGDEEEEEPDEEQLESDEQLESGEEPESEEEELEEDEEEPTVADNAKTLLDRTTQETDELKETRKEIERQQKLLERKLEEAGDDEESRKQITDQLSYFKNRVDAINTSLQTRMRKLEMANVILNKKPSLNGNEQEE